MKLIQEHIKEINELCKKYHVAELYVFGSVLTNNFKADSDIDFLVRYEGVEPLEYFDNYMDFKEGLEILFSRKIDLVEMQTVKNPILKRSIDRNKIILYGRKDSKMAV
ncbi:MAG: nucleotidyltransferase domain-containing protein [Cyclobacteriaceae bacterium]|nr:nucleotidyltransferase domain-containing protein [Cyclobacteriaceae bacterium]